MHIHVLYITPAWSACPALFILFGIYAQWRRW